jgi:hypothetical protein
MGERDGLRAALREVAVVLYFVLVALVALRSLAPDPGHSTLVGPDPLADLYTVHWLVSHLAHPAELYGGTIFAPARHGVLYSDLSMGTAVLVAPLGVVLRDPVPLYNAALLAALAFGGWAFCALVRFLTGRLVPGLVAGTLAAFSSHQMSHVYHLNLLSTGWLALFLLGLERLRERPGSKTTVLLGVSFALNAESSGYYAVAAALLALLFALLHWRGLLGSRSALSAVGGVLLALVLMAPYLRAYSEVRSEDRLRRPEGMSEKMAFHPGRDLSSVGYLDGALLGSSGERLFPGLLACGLAGLALLRRARGTLFPSVGALLLLVLSLGPRLHIGGFALPLPYLALQRLPFLDGMRHPYTLAAVGVFLVAVLAGQGVATLPPGNRLGPLALLLAVVETLAPAPLVRTVRDGVPPAYDLVLAQEPGVILEVPPFEPETVLWAARHGREVANGVGAFAPSRTLVLERTIENHWLGKGPVSVDDSPPTQILLDQFNVRYLIVPAGRKPSTARLARAMEGSSVFSLVGTAPDGDEVFRVGSAHPGEGGEELGKVPGQDRQAVGQK